MVSERWFWYMLTLKHMAKKSKQSKTINSSKTTARPPVVAILGHVDHGKTSLLDKIRHTNVQKKEAGGITQSIGAYQVPHKDNAITFIDTPGHEAFTAMRARGGRTADIVILVVAANEGVKPQTVESIGHAKAAGVPMIVAFNKADLPTADSMKVKQELLRHEVVTEDLGGDVVSVEVSALTGQGIAELLDMIALVAEMQELKAEHDGEVRGVVIEAQQESRQGIIASVVVKSGTLKQGDYVIAGNVWGKVKRLTDWQGKTIQHAGPGTPVAILGFQAVPASGEHLEVVPSEKIAKEKSQHEVVGETATSRVSEEGIKIIPLILKADTQGALEAFLASVRALNTDESMVEIVHAGLSDVTEADVMLATVSNAVILGFNVGIDKAALNAAQIDKVPIMTYDIIYQALEDVKEFLENEADQLRAIGLAEVLEVFELSNGTYVSGSQLTDGYIQQGAKVQMYRDDKLFAEGRVSSLRHGKEQKSRIAAETECGIVISPNVKTEPGDTIMVYPV